MPERPSAGGGHEPGPASVRPGAELPTEAWERRQHARTIITPEFLHQKHRQRGKRLEQIANETGIARHIISEIAARPATP
jgi:hypothetical protein